MAKAKQGGGTQRDSIQEMHFITQALLPKYLHRGHSNVPVHSIKGPRAEHIVLLSKGGYLLAAELLSGAGTEGKDGH